MLALVAQGKTSVQISKECGITEWTVNKHRSNIKSKLKLGSIAEIVRYAIENIQPADDLTNRKIIEHQKLVLDFDQTELAFEINHKLLELEKLQPDELEEINNILAIKLKKARR